ncbi:hypothetical protein OG559_19460 [Micromonospora sp. NBC_01405]|uniref:hypothetical protein n=1 Tax=Micromonospora sp. NBC_01405 TaxID=2903589 RepID=UPI003251A075
MTAAPTVADADALAEHAHRGQVDKAGWPYIEHPRAVAAILAKQSHGYHAVMAGDLLHPRCYPRYPAGMTEPVQRFRKLSISVPEDVADRLEAEPNASAFVADTIRARIELEQLTNLNRDLGITVTAEGVARARARRLAVEAEWSPERRAALREDIRRAAADMLTDPGASHSSAA